ncbi:type II secretion system major pseudopilin GspG [Microvirga sp. 0TCS3.31]
MRNLKQNLLRSLRRTACQADDRGRSRRSGDQHSRRLGSQAGFTLVEVIVVLSIMGLIMALVGPRVLGYLTDSKEKMARIQVETLSNATELFFIDNGRYPLEPEGLQALLTAPASLPTWRGPYLKGATVPADPWGRPYRYSSKDRGRSYVISTEGTPDRNEGTTPKRLSSARPQGSGREGSY